MMAQYRKNLWVRVEDVTIVETNEAGVPTHFWLGHDTSTLPFPIDANLAKEFAWRLGVTKP